MPPEPPPLIATYRLQLGPTFTLADARRTVPYLAALGISHLYLSPTWEAVPGSTHGYDIIDHARVSSALGGIGELYALGAAARRHGLGLIFDIVPNHAGIRNGVHPWWRDVLRYGQRSPYAPYFDIDWGGHSPLTPGVLVCPVLGQPLGAALEDGELTLEYFGGELVVRHFDGTFPLAPATYDMALGLTPNEEPSSASPAGALARMTAQLRDAAPPRQRACCSNSARWWTAMTRHAFGSSPACAG
jgi:(1->4)-alpha-D-glucan 1-alpha-D-glucosylmutase